MSISALGDFPNTIANLNDKPNLPAQRMKESLQDDVNTLWSKVAEIIPVINSIQGLADLPLSVANGGTGGTTKQTGREGMGIYAGSTAPASIASSLNTGDIYLYFPDLS